MIQRVLAECRHRSLLYMCSLFDPYSLTGLMCRPPPSLCKRHPWLHHAPRNHAVRCLMSSRRDSLCLQNDPMATLTTPPLQNLGTR